MLVSMQIVVYLFLGGAAAGMLLFSCLWSLRFRHFSFALGQRKQFAFDAFFSRCIAIGSLLILISILCLFWDLGRPDRVLALIFTNRPNILTLGALCLGAELLMTFLLFMPLIASIPAPRALRPVCEIACSLISVAVILYTGVYLYSMEAVAFWHSWALIAVFLFSSLSTGLSFMLLIAYFSQDQMQLLNAVRPMQRVHLACIAFEAASVGLLIWSALHNQNAASSMALLLDEPMLSTAIVGVGLMALIAPFALEGYSLASRAHRNIPASDVICLVGGFVLRYVIVACGLH